MAEAYYQPVGGDVTPQTGADWYSPEHGFLKFEVIEGENGHRADIHFLEKNWHQYQIIPNKKLNESHVNSLINDPNEVVRMVSAAIAAVRRKEALSSLSAFTLLSMHQSAELEIAPNYQ